MARKPVPKLTVKALYHDATRKKISMAEIREDALAVLGGDVLCSFDKPSKVGAGGRVNGYLNGDVSRVLNKRKSAAILVGAIK